MKIDWNRKYTTISVYVLITAFLIMLICAAFLNFDSVSGFISTLNSILVPVYIGFAIAYLANPIMKFSEKHIFRFKIKSSSRFHLKRGLSIAISLIALLIILTVLVLLIIPQLFYSLSDLVSKMSGYIDTTVAWLDDFLPNEIFDRSDLTLENFYNSILAFFGLSGFGTELTGITDQLAQNSGSIDMIISGSINILREYIPLLFNYFTGLANGIFNIILGIFFAIYMLSSKERLIAQIKKTVRAFTSEKLYNSIIELSIFSNKTFGSYLIGKGFDSFIVGIIMFILCSLLKIPYALLVSSLVAITNIIPVIGPFIGAIPGILIIFIVDPSKVLWFILLNIIVQQVDGNIIVPKILGETTGLSALWVLFSITVMGGIWGLFGMFISVPIFAILYMLIKLFVESRLNKKELPSATYDYYTDNEIRDFPDHDDNKHSFAAHIKNSNKNMDKLSLPAKFLARFGKKSKSEKKDGHDSQDNS